MLINIASFTECIAPKLLLIQLIIILIFFLTFARKQKTGHYCTDQAVLLKSTHKARVREKWGFSSSWKGVKIIGGVN